VVEGAEAVVTARLKTEDLATEIEKRFRKLNCARTAELRTLRREFSKRIAALPGETVIELVLVLLRRGIIPRFFAYELIHQHKAAASSLSSGNIESLGQGIDSWEAVDTFACYLAGPAWRENQLPTSVIRKWTKSKDRWWRRAAVVSTVPLNNKTRGGSGDAIRSLQICRLVIDDRDEMVVKALSWALRELSKRDSASVERFLYDNKGRLGPRVIREVQNKLSTGLKNPKSRRD
jgi:3-methyladenine DNA glycosylase AlkD